MGTRTGRTETVFLWECVEPQTQARWRGGRRVGMRTAAGLLVLLAVVSGLVPVHTGGAAGGENRRRLSENPCECNPCHNNGTCISDGSNHYKCECAAGWMGTDCNRAACPCSSRDMCLRVAGATSAGACANHALNITAAAATCGVSSCAPEFCALGKETPGYETANRPGLGLPPLDLPPLGLPPLGSVIADNFLYKSVNATIEHATFERADLGAVTCAEGYGLDAACTFQDGRATGAAGVIAVPGATTPAECAERVMSQQPGATGASFQEDVHGAQWCDALFNMTACDLKPCQPDKKCVVDWSTNDPARAKAFGDSGQLYPGYRCSADASPTTCNGHVCPTTATTLDDLDAEPGDIVCPESGCTNAVCCTGRGDRTTQQVCRFERLPEATCRADASSSDSFVLEEIEVGDVSCCEGGACDVRSNCKDMWFGGVLGGGGRIYGIPYNANRLLVIEPDGTADTSVADTAGRFNSQKKWRGGVLAPNGKIFGVPHSSGTLLIIEPGEVAGIITLELPAQIDTVEKFGGAALAANGRIYFAPYKATQVLKVDPVEVSRSSQCTADTCDSTTIETDVQNNYKWSGVVLAPNAKLYFIPCGADRVLIVDPANGDVVDDSSISGLGLSNKWEGGVLAPNGKIYGIPWRSSNVLVIDPETDGSHQIELGPVPTDQNKWCGGTLAPNGRIYMAPYDLDRILVVDPDTENTWNETSTSSTPVATSRKWCGATLDGHGRLHFIPSSGNALGILTPLKREFEFTGCTFNCAPGSYKSLDETNCTACPAHSSTRNTTGRKAISDCLCDPGYTDHSSLLQDGGACSLCAAGTYKASSGSALCTTCPNRAQTNGTDRTSCLCSAGSQPLLEGGWQVVLKTSGNAALAYDSPLWTQSHAASVLNASSVPTDPGDAKYPAYNTLSFSKIRVCTGQLSNCVTHAFDDPVESAAALFGGETLAGGATRSGVWPKFSNPQTSPPGVVKVGTATVGSSSKTIAFGNFYRRFHSPVVILGIPEKSTESAAAVVLRLVSVTDKTFSVYVDVPNRASPFAGVCGLNMHPELDISWAVVSSGVYTGSAENETIQAGRHVMAANFSWSNVSFARPFSLRPAVVSQVVSHHGEDWVKTRQQGITATGFDVRLEGDGTSAHRVGETVGWLAVARGVRTMYGTRFEALEARVTDEDTVVRFCGGFASAPGVFGSVSSFTEDDEVHLRQAPGTAANSSLVTLVLEEEQCGDADVSHRPEEVHVIAMSAITSTAAGIECTNSGSPAGFNVQCPGEHHHKARWGVCIDSPEVICSEVHGSGGVVGIGLSQGVGAGVVQQNSSLQTILDARAMRQAWVLVYNEQVAPPTAPCAECPADTYKTELGQRTCTACPEHTGTHGQTGAVDVAICTCRRGHFAAQNGVACEPCPVNTYATDSNSTECMPCPANSTTVNATGRYSSDACLCGPGHTRIMTGGVSICTPCLADTYKAEFGNGECHACPKHSSTYNDIGATTVSACQCGAGHNPTLYTGAGASGSKSLLSRFTGNHSSDWDGGQVEVCGSIGPVLQSPPTTSPALFQKSFSHLPHHTMLQVEFDLFMIDAAFADIGLVTSSVSIDSTTAHINTGGTLWGPAGQWTCADIFRVNPNAPDGVYSIKVPSYAEPVRVYCNMTGDGGGWTLVQKTVGPLMPMTEDAVNASWLAAEGSNDHQNGTHLYGKLSRGVIVDLCNQQYKLVTEAGPLGFCSFDAPASYCDTCDVPQKLCSASFNASGYDVATPGRSIGVGEGVGFNIGAHGEQEWTQVWCRTDVVEDSGASECGQHAPELTQHITVDSTHTGGSAMVNIIAALEVNANGVDAPVVSTSAARHSGFAIANVQVLPGFHDTFATGQGGWSSARITKLYTDSGNWPKPDWCDDDLCQVDADFASSATRCEQTCSDKHEAYQLAPSLSFDCHHSSFTLKVYDGTTVKVCQLFQDPEQPLQRTKCSPTDVGSPVAILGGYGVLGAGSSVRKDFDLAAYPHDEVTVSLDFTRVDKWVNQSARLYIDGRQVWSRAFVAAGSVNVCGDTAEGEATVAVGPFVFDHSAPSVEVQVTMDIGPATSNSPPWFGIGNVRVVPKLRWCVACETAAFKSSRGNEQCTPCPQSSRTSQQGSLNVTSCLCDPGYTGVIGSVADRCSPLPKVSATIGRIGAPLVSVLWQPNGDRPPNFNERLVILGNVTSQQDVELVWSAHGIQQELEILASTSVVMTRPQGVAQIVPLVIPPDTLRSSQSNNFKFRLTASVGELTSYAELTVLMNVPPRSGWVQAQPYNGTAVETSFILSAEDWVDEDVPLTYRFFTQDGKNQILVAATSTENEVSTMLPAGNIVDNYEVEIGATIQDAFGGKTTATTTITVMPLSTFNVDEATALLAAASGDALAVQRLATAFASSMGDEVSDEALQMRENLVDSLNESIAAMQTGTTEWEKDAVSGCLGAMATVTSVAKQLSPTATDQAINILSPLVGHLQPEDASLATATVSNLLGATEEVAKVSANQSSGSEAERDQVAAQRSVQLCNILERTAVVIGAGLVVGERPSFIATDRFRLSAQAGVPGTLAGSSNDPAGRRHLLGDEHGASVSVMPDSLAGAPTSMTQVVEWEGAGPHFWAGRSLTAARPSAPSHHTATTMGSSVLTVSFFNDSGGKVSVKDLATPAVLGMVVPVDIAVSGIREQLWQLSIEDLRKRAKGYNATATDLDALTQPQLIELLLAVPEVESAASAVYCTYWDTVDAKWKVDGVGKIRRTGSVFIANCETTHFTDFAAFLGPLPQMNRLGDLSDLPKNSTGFIVTILILTVVILMVIIGVLEYNWLRSGAEATDKERDKKLRHDKNVAHFARYRKLYNDPNVPWTHRAWIGLRTRWLFGGCVCTIRGDPYQRSQRVFIVAIHVFLSMALNIIFFDDYEECVYSCDTHMPAGLDDATTADPACIPCPAEQALDSGGTCGLADRGPVEEGSRLCTEEEQPGLIASLATVAMIIPLIGAVNLAFGWLRKPMVADIMVRSGEMWDRMQAESTQEKAHRQEELMLKTMSLKQMFEYASQEAERRENGNAKSRRRISSEELKQIAEKSTMEQQVRLEQLNQELKQHVSKQGIKTNLTHAHQECVQQIFNVKREADERTKEELMKILLKDFAATARAGLERELNDLSLPGLRRRAQRHRIKYNVEDEDAWSGEYYDDVSDLSSGFRSLEEQQMMMQHRKEAEEQIAKEKAEIIELIANAELSRPTKVARVCKCILSCRPLDAASHCMKVQRQCCVHVFPCCQKTMIVEFDEDGPLGMKFTLHGNTVELSAIKEYYQADLHQSLRVGFMLQKIDGRRLPEHIRGLSLKKYILTQLRACGRPMKLMFVPGEDNIVSDSEDEDEPDNTDQAIAAEDSSLISFWDWEDIPGEPKSRWVVEDVEASTRPGERTDQQWHGETEANVRPFIDGGSSVTEEPPDELREHAAALAAHQRLVNTVQTLKDAIATAVAASKRDRESRLFDLQQAQEDLERAQRRVAASAAAAEYSFDSCTLHVEKLPDAIGQSDIESTFSLFGYVLQVTVRRRPGNDASWALVTMAGASSVRACLIRPRKFKREPSVEQANLLRSLEILRCHQMYSQGYGHSWLEAQERANAILRSLATNDENQVRNDFGVFVAPGGTGGNDNPGSGMVPRRRARVCERRRNIAAQMRACEISVDALFYAYDRDHNGTLDREELGLLLTEINGGIRATESSVQFVLDQVKSHGDSEIAREPLKAAVVLWRYLQHEQDFVAQHFDEFDKRTRGRMIGKNEIGWLLKKLNSDPDNPDGIPPAVAEVDWVMHRARSTKGGSNINRAQLRAAIALWYPCVYNRRRVEDLPASLQSKAGRTRKAIAGMLGVHQHHVRTYLTRRYPVHYDPDNPSRVLPYKLTTEDLGQIMSDLISSPARREKVGQEVVDYLMSTADLQGADNFEPEDVLNALAMWLCTREVQPRIESALEQYDETLAGSDQRLQVHKILTLLNDGIPTTWAETDWILESSDIDGNGTVSMDEMRASVGWWFLHVARRKVQAAKGWRALMPWLLSAMVALLCAYLVAATSVRFTEEKTQRWLQNTTVAVVIKQLMIDPLKTMFCGSWLEPVAALFSLDLGLADFDLSEAIGEAIEDLGEDSLDHVGIALAAQSVLSDNSSAEKSAERNRKEAHQTAFLAGSRSVAKMRGKAQSHQVKSQALAAATEAVRDSQKHLQLVNSQRAEVNAVYAEKIAQKRLQKGMNRGDFAARAERDMAAVSQFMAAEQASTEKEQRTLKHELKALTEEEQRVLGELKLHALISRAKKQGVDEKRLQQIEASGEHSILQQSALVDLILEHARKETSMDQTDLELQLQRMRMHTPDDTFVSIQELRRLRVLRDKKRRTEKKRQMLLNKRGDMDHQVGNERHLIERAKQEGEQHERHLAHLKGLSSAKTQERVRRKQLEKQGRTMPTVLAGAGKTAGFLTKLLPARTKVSVRAADPPGDINAQHIDKEPELRPSTPPSPAAAAAGSLFETGDTLSTLALAQRGMHRSVTRSKQLKVTVPSGPLPGAARPQGAAMGLIEEVNELFPELVKK